MDRKTDLFEEFGRIAPEVSDSAYEPGPARTDEFNLPKDAGEREFGGAYGDKEFFDRDSSRPEGNGNERREKKRRTLLLQMAAVGLSAVVVTSSFGEDLLGSDRLFGGSSSSSDSPAGPHLFMLVGEEGEEPKDMDVVFLYQDGQVPEEAEEYRDIARYDPQTNTLTLDSCNEGGAIIAQNMGDDFTVYAEGNCRIGKLQIEYGGLILDGAPGSTLEINRQGTYGWTVGIEVLAAGKDRRLEIKPGGTVDIYGAWQAVRVQETTAENGIVYDGTELSGGTISSSSEEEGSEGMTWTVWDGDEPARTVVFSPAGVQLDPGIYVTPEFGGEPVAIYTEGRLTAKAGSISGFSYDPANSTITLSGFVGEAIEIFDLPEAAIEVYGENRVGRICASADLSFGGDPYGSLTVNEEKRHLHGILVEANGTQQGMLVTWGPEIEAFGRGAAVAVYDSTALTALRTEGHVTVSGEVAFGDFETDGTAISSEIRTARSWTVIDPEIGRAHV